jgi:hypothetical protein
MNPEAVATRIRILPLEIVFIIQNPVTRAGSVSLFCLQVSESRELWALRWAKPFLYI